MRSRTVVFIAAVLVIGVPAPRTSAAAAQVGAPLRLSKGQVKRLLRAAHTAEDFRLLSQYYAAESQRLEERAREHEEEAEGYASGRVFEPKTGLPGGLVAHCRYFAWYYREKAGQAKSLASHYEQLAKSTEGFKQPQPRREKL